MAQKVILDVDTGHDDMVAIVMASALKQIELMGIVAVMGNQILEKTLSNTLKVCEMIGERAPVFAGMDRPLVRPPSIAAAIHGDSGLDGPSFPPLSRRAEPVHGVRFIIDAVLAHPHEITLVATGPLTDIAMAIKDEPRLPALVKQIVLMGGSMGKGNRTEHAEFNIFVDPEAAHIVFSSPAPVVMMGLDVTLQVLLTPKRLDGYRALGTRASTMFCDSMDHYLKSCHAASAEFPAMHDPCCVAYVADPTIFTVKPHRITVETQDPVTRGKTYAKSDPEEPAVLVGTHADADRFWSLLDESFTRLP